MFEIEREYMKKSYKKYLVSWLSGDKINSEEQKPWYTLAEIADMLCKLPDDAFDEYVFAREPLGHRIDAKLRKEIAQKARESGKKTAKELKLKYKDKTIEQIAKTLGAIIYKKEMPQDASRVMYAQFVQPNEITIFTHCIKTASKYVSTGEFTYCLSPEYLENILLAHELYHMIEETDKQLFPNVYRLRLWSIGRFHNDSPVACLSEISAMAFAKELLELDFCTYALDAMMLYGYDSVGACLVCDEIIKK